MPARLVITRSKLEDLFAQQVKLAGLPEPMRNFRFHQERKWAVDFAWMFPPIGWRNGSPLNLCVEIEGGTWKAGGGRHNRGAGFRADCEKYAEAAKLGWLVLRFDESQVKSGYALNVVEELLR